MAVTRETALSVWQQDADNLKYEMFPDVQVHVLGLVGVLSCCQEAPLTVHDWAKAVDASSATCQAMTSILPSDLAEEFNDDYTMSLADLRTEPRTARQDVERTLLGDGFGAEDQEISAREYFLTRFLGMAAYNYAVATKPLRLQMGIARSPLEQFFPLSLALIESQA